MQFMRRNDARVALEGVLTDVGKDRNPPWPPLAEASASERIRRRDEIMASKDLRIDICESQWSVAILSGDV